MSKTTSFLHSIGDAILGEFKATIIGRLASVETKLDRIEKDVEGMRMEIKETNGKIDKLGNRAFRLETATVEMQSVFSRANVPISQRLEISPGSPLKLTEYGEELVKKIDGYNFVSNNKEFLFSLVAAKNPATSYDVQISSRKILDEIVTNSIMNNIKKIVYENGMNIEPILNVVGIILRDMYLEAHPEVK